MRVAADARAAQRLCLAQRDTEHLDVRAILLLIRSYIYMFHMHTFVFLYICVRLMFCAGI